MTSGKYAEALEALKKALTTRRKRKTAITVIRKILIRKLKNDGKEEYGIYEKEGTGSFMYGHDINRNDRMQCRCKDCRTNTDDTMVITENPADGSSEESGISEEEPNTDISGTTDLNEEAEADQNLQWKDAYKKPMKELVNGNFGEDLPFFGYLPEIRV